MAIKRHSFGRTFVALALVGVAGLHASHLCDAAQIIGLTVYPGINSVAGTGVDPAPTPNDDVVGASGYEITVIQKDYRSTGPVDIEFELADNLGTTEYQVIEGVSNSSGVDWSGYHLELGFGNGGSFVKSIASDGLDFDTPDENSPVSFTTAPSFFTTWSVTEDDIIVGGGVMPGLGFPYASPFIFHIDVPDGIASFTLRQSPIEARIPEPSTALLAVVGALALSMRRGRGRRASFLPAFLLTFSLGLALSLVGTHASAYVLDMEGFAPAGSATGELSYDPPNFGVSQQGDFTITVDHGHYWSSTHPDTFATSDIGGTASDWFLHDPDNDGEPLMIEEIDGNSFSVVSFQAGEWFGPFAGVPANVSTTGNPIEVTGFYDGGGTIITTFVSDAVASDGFGPNVDFEEFVFGPGWEDLVAVEFLTSGTVSEQFGYDNIVVLAQNTIPEPGTGYLLGIAVLVLSRRLTATPSGPGQSRAVCHLPGTSIHPPPRTSLPR